MVGTCRAAVAVEAAASIIIGLSIGDVAVEAAASIIIGLSIGDVAVEAAASIIIGLSIAIGDAGVHSDVYGPRRSSQASTLRKNLFCSAQDCTALSFVSHWTQPPKADDTGHGAPPHCLSSLSLSRLPSSTATHTTPTP